MINLALTFFVAAVPAYMIFEAVRSYRVATGSTWARLVAAFRGSATIFWGRLNALSVAAIGAASEIAPLVGAPGVKEAIQPFLSPGYMAAYMVFVLIGAEIARRRTLP